jgi:hypothetical protein
MACLQYLGANATDLCWPHYIGTTPVILAYYILELMASFSGIKRIVLSTAPKHYPCPFYYLQQAKSFIITQTCQGPDMIPPHCTQPIPPHNLITLFAAFISTSLHVYIVLSKEPEIYIIPVYIIAILQSESFHPLPRYINR